MSDRDNITLPREVAEHLTKMLEECPLLPNKDWSERDCAALTALRAALAAPRPEPVAATDAQLLAAYRQRGCGFYIEFKEIWQAAERFHGIAKEVQP